MRVKKEYIILAVVIIALAAYLILRKTDRTLYQLPVIAKVASQSISKIQITKGGNTITLNKKDDQWYLAPEGYAADGNKVKGMLDVLSKLSLSALVSQTKDYIRYELDDAKKITVKAWQADKLVRNFDIGKTAASFRHTFVKLADDDRVFQARESFRSRFNESKADLRDRTVLAFKPSDINAIEIVKNKKSSRFVRKPQPAKEKTPAKKDTSKTASPQPVPTSWQANDGRRADPAAVQRLLAQLSNLKCEKFIEHRQKTQFADPIYTLHLNSTGHNYVLSVFAKSKKKDATHPAISSASAYPFLLSDSQTERILKLSAQLVKTQHAGQKKAVPAKPSSKPQKK